MANLPADVINQALDAIGSDLIVGDPEEGTREAQVCLRAYGQCIRQLLRTAHWNFARKQAPLWLLGDATGQTPGVGQAVPSPWVYEYGYPSDCMKMRFVFMHMGCGHTGIPMGNLTGAGSAVPQTTASGVPSANVLHRSLARFVEGTDFNYPADTNSADGQWWEQPGISPMGRTVILTNVHQAHACYTAFVPYPNMWDSLFRSAMVAYLASEIALPVLKDKKFALELRNLQIRLAKEKITQARITDGNEGWYSTDHVPDFIRARDAGGWGQWGGAGPGSGGNVFGAWDSCAFSDGSAY